MLFKLLILALFAGILISLFSGFYFLLTEAGHGRRILHALIWRVLLSALLILLLAYGYWRELLP